jgi:hypothetical protein
LLSYHCMFYLILVVLKLGWVWMRRDADAMTSPPRQHRPRQVGHARAD